MTDRKSGVAFWAAVVVAVALAPGCESPEPTPLVVTPDMTTVVEGNTDFALDLYRQVGKEPGNLFFSPSSLSAALAMTYAGARGETAGQMADTLHFPLDSERLHPAMGALVLKGPGGKAPPYQLHVANALWGQQGYPFLPEFMALTRKHYDAGLHEVDFARATEKARQTINAWAEEQTKRKITDLVPPGVLTTLTRLVLTNAIYFKGTWVYQFDKKKTAAEPFFVTAEESHPLPLMQQKREFNYFQDSDCRVLELPYAGEDISMVVILPGPRRRSERRSVTEPGDRRDVRNACAPGRPRDRHRRRSTLESIPPSMCSTRFRQWSMGSPGWPINRRCCSMPTPPNWIWSATWCRSSASTASHCRAIARLF